MKYVEVNWRFVVEDETQNERRFDGWMNGLLTVCVRGFENIWLELG